MVAHRKKILIVEDNTLNLKLFRDVLRAKGYDTIEDRTGRNCLDLANQHQPDLIILDVLLPFASGIELTQSLSQNEKTKDIPVLGVTALAISGTLDKMIESGCVECLIKPFTLDQFIHAVEAALNPKPTEVFESRVKQGAVKSREKIHEIKASIEASSGALSNRESKFNYDNEGVELEQKAHYIDEHRISLTQKKALNQNHKSVSIKSSDQTASIKDAYQSKLFEAI